MKFPATLFFLNVYIVLWEFHMSIIILIKFTPPPPRSNTYLPTPLNFMRNFFLKNKPPSPTGVAWVWGYPTRAVIFQRPPVHPDLTLLTWPSVWLSSARSHLIIPKLRVWDCESLTFLQFYCFFNLLYLFFETMSHYVMIASLKFTT